MTEKLKNLISETIRRAEQLEWRQCANDRRGFTLIEIIVAIVILAALMAIALPQFASYRIEAYYAQAIADIRKIDLAIRTYKSQNGDWPADLTALAMADMPTDPWGRAYVYLKIEGTSTNDARKDHFLVPINSDFDLYSVGADGKTKKQISFKDSEDDIIRANDGRYVGLASKY